MSDLRPISLFMTVPPSANGNWRAVNGRVIKSKRYREWMGEVPLRFVSPCKFTAFPMQGGHKPITGDVGVEIEMCRPRKNSDLDNRIKPVLDKLATYGVIENDKQVVYLSARWASGDGCTVTITPLVTP